MAGKKMTLISWNVNGLRAAMKKKFLDSLKGLDADVVALQETKLQEPQLTEEMRSIAGYESFWSCATKQKGLQRCRGLHANFTAESERPTRPA